ncbi:MAG: hypothetical protein LBS99_04815 [Clostridiales bacterium]|jgi:hypothetical protein|nr:hypothetical protein [Clostridiales bacterium]
MRNDYEVLDILRKNLDAAEARLRSAPYDRVDERLEYYLTCKEEYLLHLKQFY